MLEVELKKLGKIERLTNKTFQFDKKLGEGFYSANYFIKTQQIIREHLPNNIVTMQFFAREDEAMVCGIDESIAMLFNFANRPEELIVTALHDGDIIMANEPVLKISGRYEDFGFLESCIDGILARRTSVATNAMRVLKAVNGKKVINMADRQDDYLTQVGDGYACYVAGIVNDCTDAMGYWWGGKGMGTMPHALIQMCGGDILKASDYYLKTFPNEKVTALIDYHNNVVWDTIKLAKHLNGKLAAVRIDTSKSLVDRYFDDKDTSGFDPHGVCKELVFGLRHELDKAGFAEVKIIVSSSFDVAKITDFEKHHVPVDVYGVGTSLLRININFTGDLVKLNHKDEAKVGRKNIDNPRLEVVKFNR